MEKFKSKVLSIVLALILVLSNIAPAYANSQDKNLSNKPVNIENLIKENPDLKNGLRDINKNLSEFYEKVGKDSKVRVAVELNDKPILDSALSSGRSVRDLSSREIKTMSDRLEAKQRDVKNIIHKNNIETFENDGNEVSANFSFTTIFNGFSTYVRASDLKKLSEIKEVKNVYLINEYKRHDDVVVNMNSSNGMVFAPESWSLGYKGEGMVVSVIDSGYDISHKDFNITDNSKTVLNEQSVSRLITNLGLKGKYYTPKFPYAYNYYDNSDKIKSETSNHGQHVAGTIAANGEIKGVAPEAQLLGMKVFSDDPIYATTFSDVYAKAIDDSIKLGADAINMSLGSTAGSYYYGSLEDKALEKARQAGILVTISAGNEHTFVDGAANFSDIISGGLPLPFAKNPDTGVLGSPSIYNGDISIASVNNVKFQKRIMEYSIGEENFQAQISPASGAPNPWDVFKDDLDGSNIVYIDKNNKGKDSKAPGDAASVANHDVNGKLVLVERGNAFTDTIVNVQNAGAKGLIIYNNDRKDAEELINMAGGDLAKIPMLMISRSHGLKIIENLDKVKLSFPDKLIAFDNPKGKLLSDFSSWGTTPELQIKPELSTPGGNIYSTDNDDGYVDMSGTSMAAPHAAGGSALVSQRIYKDKEIFGDLSKNEVGKLAKILLMNTAKPYTNEYGDLYLVRQQGAGLMDLQSALSADTYVVEKNSGEAKVELGSLDSSKITMDFVLYNKSNKTRKFEVEAFALTDARSKAGDYEYSLEASKTIENYDVFTTSKVLVPAKGKKEVRVTIDLQKAIDKGELTPDSFIEGFVKFKSLDNKYDLSVPYLGFYGDWEGLNVLDQPYSNLNDDDPSNDPYFGLTRLFYVEDGKIKYQTPTMTPAYINPNSIGAGNSGVILRYTPLRNYDRIEFSITDENGKVLENLGTTEGGRKATKMGQGDAPYDLSQEGYWDGKINGKPLEVGRRVFYTAKAYFKKDSKPQVLKFEVMADDTYPLVKDINGEFRSRRTVATSSDPYYKEIQGADVKLTYDKANKKIVFEAKDTISGVNTVLIANPQSLNTDNKQIKIWEGEEQLKEIRKLVDKENGIYEYTIDIPEEGYDNNILNVQVIDKAENTITGAVIRDEIEAKPDESNQTKIYSFNENTRILRLFVKPGSSVFLAPFIGGPDNPSIDFFNLEAFEDDDNDGIIDAKLSKKYKAMEVFSLINNGASIRYVLPVENDKSVPLAPILDPLTISDDGVLIKGMAYEAKMTILAYQGEKLLGQAESDDDGLFELKLDKSIDQTKEISVIARRNPNGLESLPVVAKQTDLKAPSVDGNKLLIEQEEIKGDAQLAFADVIFEKDNKESDQKEEFARIKSQANGRFILSDVNFSSNNLKIGDKVYIHTEKAGLKSAETVIEITEGEDVQKPSGDLTMYIRKPGLLEGYNGKVDFDIVMFGWDNVDRVSFADKDLAVTSKNYQRVINPKTNQEVYYGKAFNVKASLDLEEGYYEVPITAHDDKNNKSFSLTRRFWVDKTKPELDLVSEYRQEETEKDGVKKYTIYTNDNNVNLNFNYRDNSPSVSLYRGLVKLHTADVTGATGFAFEKSEGSYNEIIHLDKDVNEVSYEYKLLDVANNAETVRVKIVREKAETPKDEASKLPRIEASNINAYVGDKLDLLSGVKATSHKGEDITNRLKSDPETIDTKIPGNYKVKYSVTDTDGNFADLVVDVKVLARANDLVDKKDLVDAINKAEALDKSLYSLGSYGRLEEAVKEGKLLVKSISLTEEEVRDATDKINKAIEGLVDISKLSQNVDFAKDILEHEADVYTDESYSKLKEAYDTAAGLLANEDPTSRDVLRANARLSQAIRNLAYKEEEKVDYDGLSEVYEKVNNLFENLDRENYTEESVNNLEAVLAKARETLENKKLSQEEVDKLKSELLESYEALVEIEKVEVNKEALRILYEQVVNKDLSGFTQESIDKFLQALEAARIALESEEISQEEVDKARNDLDYAINNLEEIKVDKAGLEALINAYKDLEADKYTAESYNTFVESYNKAVAVLENSEASQEEVDKAAEDLEKAFDSLEIKLEVNKDLLVETIKEAQKALEETEMTEKGKEDLEKAIEAAKKVLDDANLTQEMVNQATADLTSEVDRVLKEETDLWKILEELVEKAEKLADDNSKTIQERRLLNNKIRYAKTLLRRKKADLKVVEEKIKDLREAIESME